MILVDDCSGDDTLDAAHSLKQQYGPGEIEVIGLPENAGPAKARNVGWRAAKHDLVAFLDADDVWADTKLSLQTAWMNTRPELSMTGHGYAFADTVNHPAPSPGGTAEVRAIGPTRLLFSNVFATSTVMIRRDVPSRFNAGSRRSEDYLLWTTLALSGHACGWSPLPLASTFKKVYGAEGLSADVWAMSKAELRNYIELWRDEFLTTPLASAAIGWSLMKSMRRIALTSCGSVRA